VEFSLANCDFSVWNDVPNVMTEQVGGECRGECLSRVSLSAVRPPNNSTSQLIARCFIVSVNVRIIAAEILSRIARLSSSHATMALFHLVGIYRMSLGELKSPASSCCHRYPLGLTPSSSRQPEIRRCLWIIYCRFANTRVFDS